MNTRIYSSFILERLYHPNGRPSKYLWSHEHDENFRPCLHEASHGVVATWLAIHFTKIEKRENDYWIDVDFSNPKESRSLDLTLTASGVCAEQLFCTEHPSDLGFTSDFFAMIHRLRADGVPYENWRDEILHGVNRAGEIVIGQHQSIKAVAVEFAKKSRLSASEVHEIVNRVVRDKPSLPRPWWNSANQQDSKQGRAIARTHESEKGKPRCSRKRTHSLPWHLTPTALPNLKRS